MRRGLPITLLPITLVTALALPVVAVAQTSGGGSSTRGPQATRDPLQNMGCTRIMDPKLDGGKARVRYRLAPTAGPYFIDVSVYGASGHLDTLFRGQRRGSLTPYVQRWDGRDGAGEYADPGEYTIRVEARNRGYWSFEAPVSVVRLGITEIESVGTDGADEWQMVYFRKGKDYEFFATPSLHEYLNVADDGHTSDLDENTGEPRASAPLHEPTDEPALEFVWWSKEWAYDDDCYNYPLCYARGAQPTFEVTLGDNCTSSLGGRIGCGYPVAGHRIRLRARDGDGAWSSSSSDLSPGGTVELVGPRLPDIVTRTDRALTWTFEYAATGSSEWWPIPGRVRTDHRFYTNLGAPQWNKNGSGVQYSGPWVEVAEKFYEWHVALGIEAGSRSGLVEVVAKGFFGQNAAAPTAIEGVMYDSYAVGGDSGANHYYSWGGNAVDLSLLLHHADKGPFVNCSDAASSTAVILSMLGLKKVELVRLGQMQLRCIWGIGTPDYTLDLFEGRHDFSYHHVVTRDGGESIIDTCMWVDEDGDADHAPGTPGENHGRAWDSYNDLSSSNDVSRSLDKLPKVR